MAKEEKEKSANKSVFDKAMIEYTQIVEVAKKKLAEGHSKELDELFAKLLNENLSLSQEPEMVKEESQSTETKVEESATADKPEAINMKEASMKEIEEAFDAASDEDEFKVVKTDDNANGNFSLQDIEGEISEVMSEIEAAENAQQVDPSAQAAPAVVEEDNLTKLKKVHEQMGQMIEAMEGEKSDLALKEAFHAKMNEMMGQGYEEKIGVAECMKMYETFKAKSGEDAAAAKKSAEAAPVNETSDGKTFMPNSGVAGTHNPNSAAGGGAFPSTAKPAEKQLDKATVKENELPAAVAAPAAPAVSETHGVGLSANKLVSGTETPRVEHKDYAKNKVRLALQKEGVDKLKNRINSLVNENFELTKGANKAKETLKEMTKINESYKVAIDKYRKQLNEMALVSASIANVNNILVNESLALSFEDKKKIVEAFKAVKTVEESETTYKKIIKEYSEEKKTIKESVEQKLNTTVIENSSSEEVKNGVEGNALNEHVEKIKRLSTYTSKK